MISLSDIKLRALNKIITGISSLIYGIAHLNALIIGPVNYPPLLSDLTLNYAGGLELISFYDLISDTHLYFAGYFFSKT